MISVIISSYKTDLFRAVSANIKKTIGVPHEIIPIWNPGLMSIAEAYNKGAEMAQYDIHCFCHEDLLFITQDWGQNLLKSFDEEPDMGILGVAGNKEYGALPVGWFDYRYSSRVITIKHSGAINERVFLGLDNLSIVKVKVLDGVFLATKAAHNLKFNENIEGFHAYDLAFSIEALKHGLTNYVTSNILIEHFSVGKIDRNWHLAMHQFLQLYSKDLPSAKSMNADNSEAYKRFIIELTAYGELKLAKQYALDFFFRKPLDKFNLWILKKYIL